MTHATPRRAASALLAAALTCTAFPGPAHAQSAVGSSWGSSKAPEYPNPESLDVPAPPALGSAYTGSAPLTIALALAAAAAVGLLVVDAAPSLRQAAIAAAQNLPLPQIAPLGNA